MHLMPARNSFSFQLSGIKFSDVKYRLKLSAMFFDQSEDLYQLRVSQGCLFNFFSRPPLQS